MALYKEYRQKERKRLRFIKSVEVWSMLFVLFVLGAILLLLRGNNRPDDLGQPIDSPIDICSVGNISSTIISDFKANKDWVLLGYKEGSTVELEIVLNPGYEEYFNDNSRIPVRYLLNGKEVESGDISKQTYEGFTITTSLDLSHYSPDVYTVKAQLDTKCGNVESVTKSINLSYPIYVAWTMDWEGYEVTDQKLNKINSAAKKFSNMPLTHFFNPRLLVTNITPKNRSQKYIAWVKERKDKYGDSIALHLHMFPDLVQAAGVEPHTSPAWGWYSKDGYDILVSGYSYSDMLQILEWSKGIFQINGLGTPVGFRAGGWHADEGTLLALQDSGFIYDSSGRTPFTLGKNGIPIPWNLTPTTQPYNPNYTDQNSAAGNPGEIMQIWEYPNNGGDSTGMDSEELLRRFWTNYQGPVLQQSKLVTYLSHPDYFDIDEPVMNDVLTQIDKLAYVDDKGPVIYVTLDEVYNLWR